MAKFITKGKRKRFIAITAVALSVTLSLGVFAACGGGETSSEEEPAVSTPTDTQTIKNGNFEYFTEMTEDDLAERRNLIHSPNSWTITTVSPASDTKSGIIDTKDEWNYIAKEGRPFTGTDDAYEHWNDESVTAYDRLKFLDEYNTEISDLAAGSAQKTFFDTFRSGGSDVYSIDYEDVKDLDTDFPNGITLHDGVKEGDTHVLMFHNYETSDGVLGTATYATSSTTITLKGGTAAEVSLWVCTDKLTHYYESDKLEATKDGGAYIAVTNTVGSNSSSPQFIIKNINTNGAWEKYTVYIRANTYASTTYRLVLGLGRNTSSDNRLEGVNGYAFFDDIEAKTITSNAYDAATGADKLPADVKSDLNSSAKDRTKDALALAKKKEEGNLDSYDRTFALDLRTDDFADLEFTKVDIATTTETEGSLTKDSKDIVPDDRGEGERQNIANKLTYAQLETRATAGQTGYNGYLETIFKNDFAGKFPFYEDDGETVKTSTDVIMLLSANGAAYTAKVESDAFSLEAEKYMLISFFVKTSKIRTGKTGATITLVEGENKTTISAFDSTTVTTVDIDKDNKDIYSGWVQCFFIVKNETKDATAKTFHLELNYGPTAIVGSKASDYSDGYAAFANFQTMELSKAQAGFASTGTYAKSVSLTATVKDTTRFDAAANSYNIEEQLSAPANFRGISASDEAGATDNIVTGLLNKEYKDAYAGAAEGTDLKALVTYGTSAGSGDWWTNLFGDERRTARVATQPLVIYNKGTDVAPAYGYTLRSFSSTLSANSSQRISLRLKVSGGLHAYVFLYDLSEPKTGLTNSFAPSVPTVTYWYDDEGNIVKGDPTADEFNKKTDVLYYLQDNGLYTKAGETNGTYYANLHNFKTDAKGNLVTGGENSQIVFYRNENDNADTKFYAYREGKEGSYTYSQPVENLPTDIARYDYSDANAFAGYTSVIEIVGNATTATTWAEVSFYVRTGSDAKTYGLAIWAGDPREGADNATIPADGYLFADSYKNESTSNFEAIRDERVSALLENKENRAADPADPSAKLEDKLNNTLALYSTFTFYDSDRYVRYDKSQDTDNIGSPWIDYVQSSHTEDIAWLRFDTLNAAEGVIGSEVFIDYSVSEVSVAEHVYDTDTDSGSDDTDTTASGDTNIWLILSSALLAVVLIFAIVAIVVRKLYKKHTRGKIKVVKEKPSKKKHKKAAEAEEPAATSKETPKDENDPYNE